MSWVERVGEGLVRRMDRRRLLRRAGASVFGLVAAWTVEGVAMPSALASHCSRVDYGQCTCHPPSGRYCRSLHWSYCEGSRCRGGCTYDYTYYSTACWCTAICRYGGGTCGYYRCCDCRCGGTRCGCSGFNRTSC